jgi:TetR/AcrR family transcriptional regulator, mexJK operon transcriptional repressor
MQANEEGRSARKHRQIIEAATSAFLANGFDNTNMDEIATLAEVSKQTVYKHFADKETLFAEIVLATTKDVNQIVSLITDALSDTQNLERDLGRLANSFITALMQPRVLRLRRMIIASADRFPDLGTKWYESGFEQALAAMAAAFARLSAEGLLDAPDPTMAANHFVGMLLWIPINRAMFTGNDTGATKAELARHATATTTAFLAAYGQRR